MHAVLYIYIYTHMYVNTHKHTCLHMCMYIVACIQGYMYRTGVYHIYIYIYIYAQNNEISNIIGPRTVIRMEQSYG